MFGFLYHFISIRLHDLIKIIQVTSSLPDDDNIFITTGCSLAFMTAKTPFQTPEKKPSPQTPLAERSQ